MFGRLFNITGPLSIYKKYQQAPASSGSSIDTGQVSHLHRVHYLTLIHQEMV